MTVYLPEANEYHGVKTTSIKMVPHSVNLLQGVKYQLGDLEENSEPGSTVFHENIEWRFPDGKNEPLLFQIQVIDGQLIITLNQAPLDKAAQRKVLHPEYPEYTVEKQISTMLGDRMAAATSTLAFKNQVGDDLIEHPPKNMTSDDLLIIATRKKYEADPKLNEVYRNLLSVTSQ